MKRRAVFAGIGLIALVAVMWAAGVFGTIFGAHVNA